MEHAVVRADRTRKGHWKYALVTPTGEVIAQSVEFRSNNTAPTQNPIEVNALEAFRDEVRTLGWVAVGPPSASQWWTFPMGRGTAEEIRNEIDRHRVLTFHQPVPVEKRGGIPGIWWMWGITIAVVVGLFLVCVLLAFTTEIQLTPTT